MDYRQYDNATGRFNSIDALSELDVNKSPYAFARNNPIVFGDPSGLSPESDWDYYATNDELDQNLYINQPPGFEGGFVTQNDMTSGDPFGGELKGVTITPADFNRADESYGYDNGRYSEREGVDDDDQNDFLDDWNDVNDTNDRIVSPVVGIFEAGAIRASKGVNSAVDIASNARILKVAGNISLVGNISGIGYAGVVAYNNPTNANLARLGAEISIVAIEAGLNALVPGLGFVVGFGLSMANQSDYMQNFYNGLNN